MEKREQVAEQCRAVVHMGKMDQLLDIVGQRTAHVMNVLGDILNDMDAVDDDADGWMEPIFAEAQRLWPGDDPAPIIEPTPAVDTSGDDVPY